MSLRPPGRAGAPGRLQAGRLQRRAEPGAGGRGGSARAPALSRGAALERRHQLHAGDRRHEGPSGVTRDHLRPPEAALRGGARREPDSCPTEAPRQMSIAGAEGEPSPGAVTPPPAAARPGSLSAPLSPMMRQYRELKQRYPDYLLLFRLGDFYEMFFEDARLGGAAARITLTARQKARAPSPWRASRITPPTPTSPASSARARRWRCASRWRSRAGARSSCGARWSA